jgi:chromosome segregation ATPase
MKMLNLGENMASYEDYLKELKSIADDELKKHIVTLENELKPLKLDLAKQSQENDALFGELKRLQYEYEQLSKSHEEQQRKKQEEKKKKIRLFKTILSAMLGGIIGGLFLFLTTEELGTMVFGTILSAILGIIVNGIVFGQPLDSGE